MEGTLAADGSADADRHPVVVIDLREEVDRWRWRCPNGHRGTSWEPTNSHLYCKGCKRQMDAGDDVSPEHYELVNVGTGETVPFSAIEFLDGDD